MQKSADKKMNKEIDKRGVWKEREKESSNIQ